MRKWMLRLSATGLLLLALLLLIILNPSLTYARQTTRGHCTVHHTQPLSVAFYRALGNATTLVQASELYNPARHLDICLNDGAAYPCLLRALRGPAFGWSFYNKVVLQGQANYAGNYVELTGYRWNLTQLLAHEMTHCYQFDGLSLRYTSPVAGMPTWKLEGYAEYVARPRTGPHPLAAGIAHLLQAAPAAWAVSLPDGTVSPRDYYAAWLLVQYCLEVKHQSYRQLLADPTAEATVRQQMLGWYRQQ